MIPSSRNSPALTPLRAGLLALALLLAALPARAAVVDLAALPGGPVDDQGLGDALLAGQGVSLRWRARGDAALGEAALERTGADGVSGFWSRKARSYDTAMTGGLGPFFVRAGNDFRATGQGAMLVIDYATPMAAASGRIWDIDGYKGLTEQWRITARDAAGAVVGSVLSPLGDRQTLDGLPWTWVLSEAGAEAARIVRVEIAFVGSKTKGVGVGFDGLEAGLGVTPIPASVLLLAPALAGLGLAARRRRRTG
jgi:hypothetical protein